MKVGLVLSGGAAKGAYHVGILKAFAEKNIEIDIYSGASIGALNSLLSASSCNVTEAYKKLQNVWSDLAKESPIKVNNEAVIYLLVNSIASIAQAAPNPVVKTIASGVKQLLKRRAKFSEIGLIDDEPIIDKFERFVDLSNKNTWKNIWVSTFEGTASEAAIEFFREELGIKGRGANYHYLNILEDSLLLETVLASAALPLLYQSRELEGKTHFDGGIRDNTPIKPLLGECDICFVSHLSNGSNFDRHTLNSDDTKVIEIRPSEEFVTEGGAMKAMINFKQEKVSYLEEMGYKDTSRVLNSLKDAGELESQLKVEDDEIDFLLSKLK